MKIRRTPLAMALVIVIGGLVASATAAAVWRSVLRNDAEDAFVRSAVEVEALLDQEVDEVEGAATALRAPGVGRGDLSANQFAEEAAQQQSQLSVGEDMTIALVEPATGQDAVVALREARRADGLVGFKPRNLAAGGGHLIATFEQPGGREPVLDGLDLAGVPAAREALEAARTQGVTVVSEPLQRLPAGAVEAYPALRRSGFAVVVPVYSNGTVPDPAARADALRSWVVVVVSGNDLLRQATTPVSDELDAQLALADSAGDDAAGAVFATTAPSDGGGATSLTDAPPEARLGITVERGGQAWILTVADLDGLGNSARSREPLLILGAGAALSVLLGAFVWSLASTRAGALVMAADASAGLARSEAHFRALVQNLGDLIVVADERGVITYVGPSVETLLGWRSDLAVGRRLIDGVHPEDRPRLEQLLENQATSAAIEVRVRHRNGSYLSFEGVVTNLFDDPAVAGLVVSAHDVTERNAVEHQLAHDATHDPLTRLPNRVLLSDRLGHALARSQRDGSRSAVIFLDVDQFKIVNDTRGHVVGDQLLQEVARRVRTAARTADTVGRYGGDEFVVICEDVPSEHEAMRIAQRIMDEVVRPLSLGDEMTVVGASIGIAMSNGRHQDSEELMSRADAAMYRAKDEGRGRIVLADD